MASINLATPLYGLTFGLAILALGIGAVQIAKKFIPEELSIQDRHDGRSAEVDRRKTVAATSTTRSTPRPSSGAR